MRPAAAIARVAIYRPFEVLKPAHPPVRSNSIVLMRVLSVGSDTLERHCMILFVACFVVLFASQAFAETPDDPLQSGMWRQLAARYFGDAPVAFDKRVKIIVPSIVENQAQVAVTADARDLSGVEKLIVFADLNPIQHVLTLYPKDAAPYVSFRLKVEQGTPVRAAALTSDGVWHVGGVFLDAAGGGCTAPAMARKDADWSETVGQAQGRLWRDENGLTRARFRFRHPMDTGLAKENPIPFYVERLDLKGEGGEQLAALETFEPLSEDPTLTLLLRLPHAQSSVEISGRDNSGRLFNATLAAPAQQTGQVRPASSE